MRCYYLGSAMASAALLLASQAAIAQDAARNPQSTSANSLTLPGPDGQEALRVVKDVPAQVRAGEVFNYTITVENVSDSPLVNVTVVEQVKALQVRDAKAQQQAQQQQAQQEQSPQQQAEQQQQQEQAQQQERQEQQQQAQQQQKKQQKKQQVRQKGNMIRYQVGMLDVGQSRTLTVSAVATKAGQAHACMWVEYEPTLCTTTDVVQPDFQLIGRLLFERGIETDQEIEGIYHCDQVFLEMQVTSTGDAATPPAQVTAQLPKGLTTADGQSELQLDLGAIAPNKTVEKRIPLKLDPQQAENELQLPITATAGELKAQATLPAVKILDPQLKVTMEAPKQAYIDQPVKVPVTVENPGQAPVLNASVQVEASGVNEFSAEGIEVSKDNTIALGRIDPGQSKQFTLLMKASEPTESTLSLVPAGYCVQAEQQQAKIALQGIPAVLIEVVDQVDPVPVGETTIYEIEVLNQGTAADNEIQVSATLPEGMTFVEGRGDTEVTADGQTITFAPVETLAPKDVAAWTVQVKADQAAKARLKVQLESEAIDEPIIEQEPTTLYGTVPVSEPRPQEQQQDGQSGGDQQEQ